MSEKNKIPKETIASFLSQNTCFDVTANDLTMLEDGAAYGGKYDIYVAQQEWCTLIAVVFSKGAITYHTIIAPSFLEKSNKSSITKDMKFEEILDKMREGNWFETNIVLHGLINSITYLVMGYLHISMTVYCWLQFQAKMENSYWKKLNSEKIAHLFRCAIFL